MFVFYLLYSSDAFDLQFGVVIFRLRAGFDATDSEGKAKGEVKETPLQYILCFCVNLTSLHGVLVIFSFLH